MTKAMLPKETEKNGYRYTMIDRSDKAAIYSMVNIKTPEDTSVAYEVFKITLTKAYSLTAKPTKNNKTDLKVYHYPAGEKFASNEDFGTSAWAYTTKESAMKMFDTIK